MQTFIAGYCEISLIKSASERRNHFEPETDGYYNRKVNRLTGMFSEDRSEFIASFDEYDLLIIDDLGVERSTEYAMEQMFFVIDSRYRSRRPMIITTNLKLSELKKPPNLAHARIYDRILERCAPILFDGKNFREENAGATRQAAKDIVNSKHD